MLRLLQIHSITCRFRASLSRPTAKKQTTFLPEYFLQVLIFFSKFGGAAYLRVWLFIQVFRVNMFKLVTF